MAEEAYREEEKVEDSGGQVEDSGGTVIRSDDGSIYLLRDELLASCKVTEPEAVELCNTLLDEHTDVSAFQMGTGYVVRSVSFLGPFQTSRADWTRSSTVMCPGNMRWFNVRVRPTLGQR